MRDKRTPKDVCGEAGSQGNSLFVFLKVIPTYARQYLQLALDPVYTYPDIFESATFSFQIKKCPCPHVSGFKSNLSVHTYPDSL